MSNFTQLVVGVRSLIYVQTEDALNAVIGALRVKLVPYYSTYELGPIRALLRYVENKQQTAALVAMLPALTSQVAIRADRFIWIEGPYYRAEPNSTVFELAKSCVRGSEFRKYILKKEQV